MQDTLLDTAALRAGRLKVIDAMERQFSLNRTVRQMLVNAVEEEAAGREVDAGFFTNIELPPSAQKQLRAGQRILSHSQPEELIQAAEDDVAVQHLANRFGADLPAQPLPPAIDEMQFQTMARTIGRIVTVTGTHDDSHGYQDLLVLRWQGRSVATECDYLNGEGDYPSTEGIVYPIDRVARKAITLLLHETDLSLFGKDADTVELADAYIERAEIALTSPKKTAGRAA
jgi:hypothetical protein